MENFYYNDFFTKIENLFNQTTTKKTINLHSRKKINILIKKNIFISKKNKKKRKTSILSNE